MERNKVTNWIPPCFIVYLFLRIYRRVQWKYLKHIISLWIIIAVIYFILNLAFGFNRLGKDNYKTRWEAFKFWDLVYLY